MGEIIIFIFLLIFGIALFVYSYKLLRTERNNKDSLKIYGISAYVGSTMAFFAFVEIITFNLELPKYSWVVIAAIPLVLSRWLIAPGFKNNN